MQQKKQRAHLLVIVAGGLGCPALMYLSASAGSIEIIDADRVDVSNLQGQVLSTADGVVQLKVEVAARRLRARSTR